jgi:TetR/AcrR family transcriptional repressor of nem operon
MINVISMTKARPRARPGKKQETHVRIVRVAASAIRKHGYDGVSVADVMKEAGLTHGGFYAHFASRDAMLAEALEHAAAESLRALSRVVPATDALEAIVDSYLSDRHVDAPELGCSLAALGSETRRQNAKVRQVGTRGVKDLVDLIARQLPARAKGRGRDDALAVLSCLVGALLIARAVDEPALSRDVRKAARRFIRAGLQPVS